MTAFAHISHQASVQKDQTRESRHEGADSHVET
jgi:hypothetical protein